MMSASPAVTPVRASLSPIRKVLVFGGAGFVGRHIVRQLHQAGYEVVVPTRNRERAKALIVLPGVDVVEADIHDPAQLDKLLAGMDAAINLVGILHETRPGRVDLPSARRGDFHATHVELPRKIVQACVRQGVSRLLHMSALHANPVAQSAYLRSKGVGEAIVREADLAHSDHERWYLDGPKFIRGAALATTVFRPSVIFGEGDAFLNLFARLVRLLPIVPLASAAARFQPVWVGDVARAFVASLENPATAGQAYDLCGPKVYTLHQLVRYVAQVQGLKCGVMPLGPRLSYLQAWLLEKLPGKLMTRDNYYSMRVDSVCECDFPAVFGGAASALEHTAPTYLAPTAARSRYDGLRHTARR